MKYGKNRLHGFRGEVVWKCWWTDDGRSDDGRRMPAYNISWPMNLRLRWAKQKKKKKAKTKTKKNNKKNINLALKRTGQLSVTPLLWLSCILHRLLAWLVGCKISRVERLRRVVFSVGAFVFIIPWTVLFPPRLYEPYKSSYTCSRCERLFLFFICIFFSASYIFALVLDRFV